MSGCHMSNFPFEEVKLLYLRKPTSLFLQSANAQLTLLLLVASYIPYMQESGINICYPTFLKCLSIKFYFMKVYVQFLTSNQTS